MARFIIVCALFVASNLLPSMVLAQRDGGGVPGITLLSEPIMPGIRVVSAPLPRAPTMAPPPPVTISIPSLAPPPPPPIVTARPVPIVALAPLPSPPPPPVAVMQPTPPPPVATPVATTTVAMTEPQVTPQPSFDPDTRSVWVGFRDDRPADRRGQQIQALVCFGRTPADAQSVTRPAAVCRRWAEGSGWVQIPREWDWNRVAVVAAAGTLPANAAGQWVNYHAEWCATGRDAPRTIMVTSEDATMVSHRFARYLSHPRTNAACR